MVEDPGNTQGGAGGYRRGNNQGSADQHESFALATDAALPPSYSLVRKIGDGSLAHVFLVRNLALRRFAAFKVLRRELASDAIARKRFIREAQAAARIQHPSVTTIYAVGALANDTPFIEMQYVDGVNLSQLLRAGDRLAPSLARKLLTQLAGALAAAHERNVIHRAVDPSNVLIESGQEHAFLTDFGVAGILESGTEAVTRLTREGDLLGNPDYMSPEQLLGEALTPRSDIYGFGLLGYEMLTLEGPFANADIKDVAAAHVRREPLDLHAVYPHIPEDLSEILRRCLDKKPEHRPTAALLKARLDGTDAPVDTSANDDAGMLGSFLKELKQRNVYRAAATYAAAVFLVLQVADLVLPSITSSELPYRILVVVSLAFFPMLIALSWVYDLRQGSLTRTGDSEISGRRLYGLPRVLMQIGGLLISAAISAAMAWWLLAG